MRRDCGGYALGAMAIRAPSELIIGVIIIGVIIMINYVKSWN